MTDAELRLDLLDKVLARNVAWIRSADTKATLLLAVNTAMLGVLAALVPATNTWTAYSTLSAAIATIALLTSGGFLVAASFPRLGGPRGSLVYFEGIASHDINEYVTKMVSAESADILADFAKQCHRNAEIAKAKFKHIRSATICVLLSVAPWLVAISLLYHARLAVRFPG